ncbi:MAG: hypothetical protein KDB27_14870, partial [Planctomycetales bacterium]|nr:hypothetical protein [Planctomycetales bacterium]
MRLAKYVIVGALFALVVYQFGYVAKDAAIEFRDTLAERKFEENTTRSTAYVIPTDRWLEYEVAPNAKQVRVLTNASLKHLPPDDTQSDFARPGWRYSVDYQLLNSKREVVQELTYNFRATVSRFRDPITNDIFSPYFFATTPYVPASTRTLQCPLESLDDAVTRIRLRLSSSDPLIAEVVCRVVNRVERPDYRDPTIWGRLSKRRRESLCRASVYGPELLTPSERRSLLRWEWAIAAPFVDPYDPPTKRVLYHLDEVAGDELGAITPPQGISIDAKLRGSVRLPQAHGTLHMELEHQVGTDTATTEAIAATVTYHRSGIVE